jgi:hypothetical protein
MLAIRGAANPATPTKVARHDGPVEKVFRQLNDDYDLGLELPDPSLTPSRRKQLGNQNKLLARSDQISRGISFLYWQRDDSLDEALVTFFNKAKAESLRWVPEPRADPGTLPSSTAPPKAQTADEQESLQSILIAVLEHFKSIKINKKPAPLFSRANGGVAAVPRRPNPPALSLHVANNSDSGSLPESPVSAGSKRSFEFHDTNDHDAKRPRGEQAVSSPYTSYPSTPGLNFASALDNVPTRQHPGSTRPFGAKSPSLPGRRPHDADQGSPLSSRSSETSSTKLPNIFSSRDAHSTQSTVEASFHGKERAPTVAAPSSVFAVATRTVAAASRTLPGQNRPALFAHVEVPPSAQSLDAAQQSPTWSSASTSYTDFSDPGDALMPAASHEPTLDLRDTLHTPIKGGHTALQTRLQNIWREFRAGPDCRRLLIIAM